MILMAIIAKTDETFGVQPDVGDFDAAYTIEDFNSVVRSRMKET
jgi:hypothetical protein